MRAIVVALVVLSVSCPAFAQRPGADRGWAEVFDPARRQGRARTREGLALLVRAMSELDARLGDEPKWLVLERALLRFERARRALPDDPELAYFTAFALTEWQRPGEGGNVEMRSDEAIEAWHRLRVLAPEMLPDRVAYHLAMLHMRRHEFDRARAEYEAAIERATPRAVGLLYRFYMPTVPERALAGLYSAVDRANLHGNLAEVLMLCGEVRAAEGHYRQALDQTEDPYTRSLAQWGLALALERAGDHDGALEWADRALRETPISRDHPRHRRLVDRHGDFALLHMDFVFFEPAYEIHAYEAIGHEAIAARDVDGDAWSAEDALRSWRMFLAEGGAASRFATQARRRVEALEPVVEALGEREEDSRPRRRPDLFRF